ncbi:MAG: carboxypeptidase-like regulatory domain-containing protein [Acidobacteria bacterium]|nr:carboxypeptidase-like regulatory domain-containing protein [Acidobacteriota bacterium]MCL5288878.1 carboxypeptidase-like regulatory domain-containing protein [Acidobacteriota bacterium]
MKSRTIRTIALCGLMLGIMLPASAGTLSGTVRNGTTGAVVPNQDVILIQLQGGMQSAGTFKTDAQGRYTMDHPAIGQAPVLVRVQYRGVNYHQNVPPGTATADIEVFDSTPNSDALHVFQRVIVLQPNGAVLLMGEEFSVHNESKPPVAVFKEDGSFIFDVPSGAELGQVSAAGPSGMPLVQGTIEKGKGRYAIAFPMRPGENNVRVSYQFPYANNEAKIRATSPYAAQRVVLIAPPTMTISGAGFAPAGSEQGFNLYARDNVPANTPFDFSVSGTAPPPSDMPAQSSGMGGPAESGAAVSTIPGRLDHLKWVLLGGFAALFALGAIFLWKRPLPQPAHVSTAAPRAASQKPASKHADADAVVTQVTESASRSAAQSLEEMKETLFRLELRRQAGTISEDEYARELQSAQQKLRDLLA